jgi:endonuclease YncB( thermonuclease family)
MTLVLAVALATISIPTGQSFAGVVTRVYDADGPIDVTVAPGRRVKVRLQGVGAVEADGSIRPGQPHGILDPKEARRRTAAIAMGKRVVCVSKGSAGRDRTAAWCTLPDGRDLSCAVIVSGAGARWPKYDSQRRLVDCGRRGTT